MKPVKGELPFLAIEQRILESQERCARQRGLVASLADGGYDVGRALELLALLEQIQALLEQHRERLLKEAARAL